MQISLGCGNKEEKDFFGYDSRYYGWNTVWKAPNPIPLEDETVDFVKAHKFLEHIPRESWIPFFNECHRVLKSGCKLDLIKGWFPSFPWYMLKKLVSLYKVYSF